MGEIVGAVSANKDALDAVLAPPGEEERLAKTPVRCAFAAGGELYDWSAPTREAMRRRLQEFGAKSALAICQYGVDAKPAPSNKRFGAQPLSVVLTGRVDNVRALRKHMGAAGLAEPSFNLEQLIAALLAFHLRNGRGYGGAAHAVLNRLEGQYSFLALLEREGEFLLAASKQGGLHIGYGPDHAIAVSDNRFKLTTDETSMLQRGDVAILRSDNITIIDGDGMHIEKRTRLEGSARPALSGSAP